jgi:hypothetical protein
MTTLHLKPSINRSPLRLGLLLIPLVLVCFALSPTAQGGVSPAPDGGYPNNNTAEGDFSLAVLTTGSDNTALGFAALNSTTTGSDNTATGFGALFSNTLGNSNTASGVRALLRNTIGADNTANGFEALVSNIDGASNTAVGDGALFRNTHGSSNTATGLGALAQNTNGGENTAVGEDALFFNNVGSGNIALGVAAGINLSGDDNIDIGNGGSDTDSGTIRIGNAASHMATFIAGIKGVDQGSPTAVFINTTTGQLGTVGLPSSRRFKHDIKPMDKTSDAILGLKPVTFHYKSDGTNTPQFGLIAEEVAEVNPDLVIRDKKGEIYSVRYEAVNAMLLNEFLKEHKKVEEHQATIVELKSTVAQQQKDFQATVAQQQKQIEALTAGLQKVSAQLEVSKPAPQTVLNQ